MVAARSARMVFALGLAVAVLSSAGPLRAQVRIEPHGRVVEAGTGDPVAGAEVRIAGSRTVSAISGEDGRWRVDPVPAGRYRVRATRLGFLTMERGIDIGSEEDATIELALTPRALPLDGLVVTASRHRQRLRDVPVTTEVVSREAIRRTGAADLAAVLVERTGVAAEGGHPVGAGVMLQGLGSERVLVLLDGQPFIGRLAGRIDLSRIPTSMVERVEVVKGPQSTLYGSEAMGGVVNVITRRPVGGAWVGGARATAGTEGRRDANAHVLGGVGPLAFAADAGHRRVELTPGRASGAGALSDRWDGLAKARWTLDEAASLHASAFVLDERQRWRSGQLSHFADNRQAGIRAAATWTGGPHRLSPTLYATEFRHLSRRATSPEPVDGTGEDEVQRLLEAELLYTLEAGRNALVAGVEAQREAIRSDRVSDRRRTLHTIEPFVQYTRATDEWSVAPGLRLSWSERWGTHWTPRLATLFRPRPSIAVRISVGRGYRAPDFKELYMSFLNVGPGFGYTVRGNVDLRPETSTNVTASVEWAPGPVYLRAQLFHNAFDDFIETRVAGDSSGITLYDYGNIEDGRTRGAELEAGWSWRALRAEASYSRLEAERADTGERLLGRPRHSGRVTVSYALPFELRAGLTGLYTGATPVRRTDEAVIERDGFSRLDLRLAQGLPHGFELSLGVDNLLDAEPDDWPGYTGRHLYLGFRWRGVKEANE